MLNRYKDLLSSYEKMREQYNSINKLISAQIRMRDHSKSNLEDLEGEKDRYYEDVRERMKESKIDSFEYILNNIKQCREDIKSLEHKKIEELSRIDLSKFINSNQKYYDLVDNIEPTINYINANMDDLNKTDIELSECIDKLSKLCNMIGADYIVIPVKEDIDFINEIKQLKSSREKAANLPDKIRNFLTIPDKLGVNNKIKVGIYSLYLLGIGLSLLNLSFLLIGLVGIEVNRVVQTKQERDYINLITAKLSEVVSMFSVLEETLKENKEKYKAKEESKIEDKYANKINDLDYKCSELDREYDMNIRNISLDEHEIQKELDKVYSARYEIIQQDIKESEDKVNESMRELNSIKERTVECGRKLDELKEEITNVYWKLSSVGSSKLMVKEFILGFSQRNLICMEYKSKPFAIVYDGDTSENNSILINMIIAQCLCNMLPNILHFDIVDVEYTCRDYMMYSTEGLKDVFKFTTIQNDIKNLISLTHEDLLARQGRIAPIQDDIEKFNELMIQRESFTCEYSFLIIQNLDESLLEDQLFKQICRTGPMFGIIPILFLSRKKLKELLSEEDKRKKSDYEDFFKSVEESCWAFNQRTLDLEETEFRFIGGK